MKTLRIRALVLAAAALSLITTALAAGGKHVQGRLAGPFILTEHSAAQASVDAKVSGKFTHLGRVESTFHTDVELDEDGNLVPVPPSTGMLRTPGGSTLSFTFKWKSEEVAPNVFAVAGPFETTGGTGLLAGTRWTGDYRARLDLNTRLVVIDGAGTLTRK